MSGLRPSDGTSSRRREDGSVGRSGRDARRREFFCSRRRGGEPSRPRLPASGGGRRKDGRDYSTRVPARSRRWRVTRDDEAFLAQRVRSGKMRRSSERRMTPARAILPPELVGRRDKPRPKSDERGLQMTRERRRQAARLRSDGPFAHALRRGARPSPRARCWEDHVVSEAGARP